MSIVPIHTIGSSGSSQVVESTDPAVRAVHSSPIVSHPVDLEKRLDDLPLEDGFPKFNDMTFSQVALILLSLGLASFLFAIEETIVATSVAGIGSGLNVKGSLSWITTSYLLTTTVFQPITGRVADAVGTKRLLIIEVWVFIAGNIIAGTSRTLTQLVAGRLLSGVGGAGLLSLSTILISQLTHERQRASYLTFVNVVFTVADSIGPLVGGAFSKSGNWRWIFLFNAPFGPIITLILLKVLHVPSSPSQVRGFRDALKKVDFIGMIILISFLTLLVVALNLGGQAIAWNSSAIIGLFCGAGISFIAFIAAENFAELPVVPMYLFMQWQWRNVPIMMVARCLLFFHLFATTFYLPVFLQVIGIGSLAAGALVIPFLLTAALASAITNHIASTYGHVRPLFLLLLTPLPVGMGLMSTLDETSSLGRIVGYSLICGVGFGSGTQISVVIAQVGLPDDLLSTVTAIISSVPNLGGVLGVGIIGTIINNSFRHALTRSLPPSILATGGINFNDVVSLMHSGSVPHDLVIGAYVSAWRKGLWVLSGIAVTQLLLCLGLRSVEFRDGLGSMSGIGIDGGEKD